MKTRWLCSAIAVAVANTWNNRLCTDNALPEPERLTKAQQKTYSVAAGYGLQSAGLLGPVRVMVEDSEK